MRPLRARLKRGGLIAVPIGAIVLVMWKTYAYVTKINWVQSMPGPEVSDFFAGIITIAAVATATFLIADKLINTVPFDRPFLKLLAKHVPLFNIPRRVKDDKDGEVFREVVYRDGGLWRKGILMCNVPEEITIGKEGKTKKMYAVWEPRPLSPGGRIGFLEEGQFEFTGRTGLETLKQISTGYGMI